MVESQHTFVYHFSCGFNRHVRREGILKIRHRMPTVALFPNPRSSGVQTMCFIPLGIVDQNFVIQILDDQAVLTRNGSRFLN